MNNTSGFSTNQDMSIAGTLTISSNVTFTPDAAVVLSGSGTLTGSGTARITRTTPSAEMNSQYTITTKTLTNLTAEYYASSAQTVSALTYGGLKINNSAGVSLGGNVTVNGILTLASGNVTTSSNNLIIGASGSVSRTSGHVIGNLRKTIPTGVANVSYEVGDASVYSPISLAFGNVSVSGTVTTKVTGTEHTNIGTSNINPLRSVNRYWTLTNSGTTFDNYTATATFVAGDVDAGADPLSSFIMQRYASGTWNSTTTGTNTSTSTQGSGSTAFGDIAVGKQLITFTLTPSAGSNGSINPSAPVIINEGLNQSFSMTPSTGYHIDSVIVDGSYAGTSSTYDFNDVTTNHTIDVKFAINTYNIVASVNGNGSATPSGTTVVNYGANQSYSIAGDTGYHIDSVLVDGVNQGAIASYDFTNVTANRTIAAYFTINSYTVTAIAVSNGSISSPGVSTVHYGGINLTQ